MPFAILYSLAAIVFLWHNYRLKRPWAYGIILAFVPYLNVLMAILAWAECASGGASHEFTFKGFFTGQNYNQQKTGLVYFALFLVGDAHVAMMVQGDADHPHARMLEQANAIITSVGGLTIKKSSSWLFVMDKQPVPEWRVLEWIGAGHPMSNWDWCPPGLASATAFSAAAAAAT